MRRQAQYLYVTELLAGARVLELPCGTGEGARFLAEHGAARVIGVDPSARAIEIAKREHRLTNLELRCGDLRALELEDGTIDCILIPDGPAVVRRGTVLEELRRVLSPDGSLVVAARRAERGGGGGVSYHELVDRLAPLFAPVVMIAQTPVSGWAMVGYSDTSELPVSELVVDRTLLRERTEISDYLAICGRTEIEVGAYTLFQEPPRTLGDVALASSPGPTSLEARPTVELPSVALALEARPTVELPAVVVPAEDRATLEMPAVVDEPEELEDAVDEDAIIEELVVDDEEFDEEFDEEADGEVEEDDRVALREARAEAESLRAALSAAEERNRGLSEQLGQVRERASRAEDEVSVIRSELEERVLAAAAAAAAEQALEDSDQLELALTREAERRVGLEGSLEEAERARAELEEQVAESSAAAEEMRAALVDVDPVRAAKVEFSARERVSLAMKVRRTEEGIESARQMLAELSRAIAELADAHLESGGAADDEQLRQMAIAIGVKEAELTLLNIGVSSLQGRMGSLVERVRETRESMIGRSAPEMIEMMEALEDALAVGS